MKSLGVVMIVKNEEALLSRCLSSVKDADEIVICDTGSEDNTVEIAKQYTDKVFTDYKWNDSFAEARNHAKSKCTTDWILSIDADEFLWSMQRAREAIEVAFMAVDCTLIGENSLKDRHLFTRLFRNSPQVWWDLNADVHNHLSVTGENLFPGWKDPDADGPCNVRITYGYSPAHRLDPNRAMRILENSLRKNPNNTRSMFYLAREYFYRARYEEVVVMLGRYVQQSGFLAEKAEAFLMMSRSYYYMRMMDDARDAIAQALIINPNWSEACLFMATLAGDGSSNPRWQSNADQWKRLAATASNENVLFLRS